MTEVEVQLNSAERRTELHRLLFELDRKIKPLEWDDARNQINEFKKQTLIKLKAEQATLTQEMSALKEED